MEIEVEPSDNQAANCHDDIQHQQHLIGLRRKVMLRSSHRSGSFVPLPAPLPALSVGHR